MISMMSRRGIVWGFRLLMLDILCCYYHTSIIGGAYQSVDCAVAYQTLRIYAVACFCDETSVLREWVDHYLRIGFSKLFMFDNSRILDHNADILNAEVESGSVVMYNKRGERFEQRLWFTWFYRMLGPNEWCLFTDVDEYISLGNTSIFNYVERIIAAGCDNVKINWITYGNNGHYYKTNGTLIERFPLPIQPLDYIVSDHLPYNRFTKCFVHGGLNLTCDNPHFLRGNGVTACTSALSPTSNNTPFVYPGVYDGVYIRHYITRSQEEWDEKMVRWKNKYPRRVMMFRYRKFNKNWPNVRYDTSKQVTPNDR